MSVRLFRVIVPVSDLKRAIDFYESALDVSGQQVSPGRYYIDCGGTILALFDTQAEDGRESRPSPEHIYFACPDLEAVFARVHTSGVEVDDGIRTWPWGERSFYAKDPFGNPICFVDEQTVFRGGAFIEEH
jgi:predicted enzyme related to lactoylglutathione lyase